MGKRIEEFQKQEFTMAVYKPDKIAGNLETIALDITKACDELDNLNEVFNRIISKDFQSSDWGDTAKKMSETIDSIKTNLRNSTESLMNDINDKYTQIAAADQSLAASIAEHKATLQTQLESFGGSLKPSTLSGGVTTPTPTATPTPQSSPAPASGVTTNVPSDLPQTGICANNTSYTDFGNKWTYDQGKLYRAWEEKGSTSDGSLATIDGRYMVAVSPKFGRVGDNIEITLNNGEVIPAVIADVKGGDAGNEYGHYLGNAVDVVEWETTLSNRGDQQATRNAIKDDCKENGWYGSGVASITNTGSGNYFA